MLDEEIAAFVQGDARDRSRVEQHVDGCSTCATLLHEAMRALNTSLALNQDESVADWVATFARGALVAQRYEIRRFIARGGMGEVYEAYDRTLQERVALKTVCASASDSPRAIRAFKAEVQLARRVTHPNVCRIYDLGVHHLKSDGVVHFLTMEFVEGETLGQILRKQGPLPLEQCQRFATMLLQALAAAHFAGILHRDFKSDNVMVRRGAEGELTPVILDFGLARHLDERVRSSGHAMVGTLTYMAPEQVDGSPLSKATDIYAFGVVWFEMLTGRVPFAGSPQLSALERLTKPPAAPSRFNREVPRAIDEAVLRCLARQPGERFQSAQEVLSALEAARERPPVSRRRYAPALAVTATATAFAATIGYFDANPFGKTVLTIAPAATATARRPLDGATSAGTATLPSALPAPPPSSAPSPSASGDAALAPSNVPTSRTPSSGAPGGSAHANATPSGVPHAPGPTASSVAPSGAVSPSPPAAEPLAASAAGSAPPPAPSSAAAQSPSNSPAASSPPKREWRFGLIPRALEKPSATTQNQKRAP